MAKKKQVKKEEAIEKQLWRAADMLRKKKPDGAILLFPC